MSRRLDQYLVDENMVPSRSRAEDLIKLGRVRVNGRQAKKPAQVVDSNSRVHLKPGPIYVSRGGDKLAGAARHFAIDWAGRIVADIGANVGGFSDFALRAGAGRVVAIDVGRQQLATKLQQDQRLIWLPKTDAREIIWPPDCPKPNLVLVDLAFISCRLVLGHLVTLVGPNTDWIVLAKPQFETAGANLYRGLVKNSRQRRQILKDWEAWLKQEDWIIEYKIDAALTGASGNQERFYHLKRKKPVNGRLKAD